MPIPHSLVFILNKFNMASRSIELNIAGYIEVLSINGENSKKQTWIFSSKSTHLTNLRLCCLNAGVQFWWDHLPPNREKPKCFINLVKLDILQMMDLWFHPPILPFITFDDCNIFRADAENCCRLLDWIMTLIRKEYVKHAQANS